VIWVATVAGISYRVGYARRLSGLLTHTLPYTKPEGRKHEIDYNFDLVKLLGVKEETRELTWSVLHVEKEAIDHRLNQVGIARDQGIIVIHPDASSASKRWPKERFGQLAGRLAKESDKKVILVAGKGSESLTQAVARSANGDILDWGGQLNIRELAALIKRSALVISNDSGPMHIASAVGTPVIAIFGRTQPGLGSVRWGPVGKADRILQKDPGCNPCIPDPCPLNLECLTSLSVEEVLSVVQKQVATHG